MLVSWPAWARSGPPSRVQNAAPPAASAATRPRRPSARTPLPALTRARLVTGCSFIPTFLVVLRHNISVVDAQRDEAARALAVGDGDWLGAVAVLSRVRARDPRVPLDREAPGRSVLGPQREADQPLDRARRDGLHV